MIPVYRQLSWCVFVLVWLYNILCLIHHVSAYNQVDEASYLANFGQIIANSYSQPLPDALIASTCKTNVAASGATRTLGVGTISAASAQSICSIDSTCIIPSGTTLLMDNPLVVGALINRGTIQWTSSTQSLQHQWLCAGYIVTEGGTFTLDLQNSQNKYAYIYIKNNGATHPILRSRSFGGSGGARIRVLGAPLTRTWSLLARPVTTGSSTITLMHDVTSMGWRVGDRIIIAPTTHGSSGRAESYRIAGINANQITLGQLTSSATATTQQAFKSNISYIDSASAWSTIMSAEVIHMTRNIIITGDDFTHRGCRNDITSPADDCMCMPNFGRTQCTLGLHTVLVGTGGLLQLTYTRVEKCGQRGILGKYCIHTHLSSQCPDCIIRGNSIEYGHQRGIVVHGTHLSTVEQNVISDVRGAHIYIEDGNEMYNRILYNVAICPWPLSDPYLQGCTIPGTDNDQSDTTINQAGIWALSFSNDIIGNRMVNSYNGMLYQAQGYEQGRDETQGQICPNNQQIGRLEGNTFHGHGRFGTYILASIYPKTVTARTLNNNGLLPNNDFSTCAAATPDGIDRGLMVSFYRNIDYSNTFVGQYNMGDIQYVDHTSIECNNVIYWKETKNPVDGCSSYYLNGYFEGTPMIPGTVALPSGHGTVVLENIVLAGTIIMESSHHCQEGWTGVLCMPTYVFHNVRAPVKQVQISYMFGKNNGAMYTLSPDDPTNANGNLFPAGYISLAHPFWSYLLALDGGRTCFTASSVASSLGEDVNVFNFRYGRGILCRRPLRRLEIWTPKLTTSMNPPNLRLELIQNNILISYVIIPFFQISGGELGKQGYAITLIPGTTHQYRLMREDAGPIDNSWVIEFSDTIFGNRWPRDEILLTVVGRSCPSPVHSLHDRRFIWYDSDNHPFQAGRGACTSQPDMSAKNCQNVALPPIGTACPEKCPGGCNNGYCDCGRGLCQCNAGFYGPNCAQDVCTSSFVCHPTYGRCTARYLGGTLPPVEDMCACKPNIFGPTCNIDPCAGQTCSGRGKCQVLSQTSIACICDPGWHGGTCSVPCSGSSCEPACLSGFQYYQDSNLESNIYDRQYSGDAATCAQQCAADGPRCVAALFYNGNYCGKLSAIVGARTSFPGRIFLMRCSTASLPPPAATGPTDATNVVINPTPVATQPPVTTQAPVVSTTTAPVPATSPPVTVTSAPTPSSSTRTSASTASISFSAFSSSYTVSGVISSAGDSVTLSLSCADTSVRLTSITFMSAYSSTVPQTDISQPGCTGTGSASTLSCSMTYKPLPLYVYVMWNIQGISYRMQHPLPQAGVSPFLPALQFSTTSTTTTATTPPTNPPIQSTPAPVTQAPATQAPATQAPATAPPPVPSSSTTASIPFTAYGSSYTVTGSVNSACTSVALTLTAGSGVTLTSIVFMVAYSTSTPMTDISQPGCSTSGSASTLSCTMTLPYQRIPLYVYVMWNAVGVPYRMQNPLPVAGVSPFLPAMNLACAGGAAGVQGDDDTDTDLDLDPVITPPPTNATCMDCSMVESGWDYMGMDLSKKPIPARHHTACCSICSSTRDCHAYSYYDGYCYLKSTSAGRVRRIGSTSSTLCTAALQNGYQDPTVTYDVTIASCINDKTCQQIHGTLSQCVRVGDKGATGYCHCRKDAVISGSGQCIRASKCSVCPPIPDCPTGRYPVVKTAAAPDHGRCCHQYTCVRMGGRAAAGVQTPAEEIFGDDDDTGTTTTTTGSSRMKSMMITIGIISSIVLLSVIAAGMWSYRKHQAFKFHAHRDENDDDQRNELEGTVPITHGTDTSTSEYAPTSPSPVHFPLSSLTTSTSNSSISDSFVPASPATLWNMSRMVRSDSTDVMSDSNLTSIPEFSTQHFSISRRHQYSRAPSPEPNLAAAPDSSPESHNKE